MNTSTKVLPPPRHFFSFHCNTCKVDSKLFVNSHPATNAGRRHICNDKKITIFHHIFYWNDATPVKEIWGVATNATL